MQKGKKVLILGGAGFLGANLARYALKQGATVTVADSLDPRLKSTLASLKEISNEITFVEGDIRDDSFLKKVIPDVDIIFNCAGQSSHPLSMKDPIFDAEINAIGTLKVLTTLRDHNPSARVIYTSSSTLVGKAEGEVTDDNYPEHPLDIYSANKGIAEKYHFIFHKAFNLKTTCLRFANLYGAYGKNDPLFGFVNYFIEQARGGKPITVWGSGSQTRNLLYAEDACDILWRSAEIQGMIGESFFATHHEHHRVKAIADMIAEVFGTTTVSLPWPDERKKIDVDSVQISSQRLYDISGWKPKYSLKEGLEKTRDLLT